MHHLACEKRTYGSRAKHHAHDYSQLILPLVGKLELQLDAREFFLSKEKFCFLPPQFVHGFRAKGDNQFLVLDIPKSLSLQSGRRVEAYKIDQAMDSRWEAIRSLVIAEIESEKKGDLAALMEYIWSMLAEEEVLKSVVYMKKNLSKPVTIKELALMENYNPSYYSEWFQNKMGDSPQVFLQRLRLEKAKELLKGTNDSLLQIALAVGYEQQSSLSRLFLRFEGCSPSAFRQRSRNSAK